MKRAVAILLLLILLIPIYSQTNQNYLGIEAQIGKILEITNTPGCAIAVVKGESVIYTKGFGYSNYEDKVNVDTNTLFPIGSATKAFTAALVGQLREKGVLTFMDSPLKYIPSLRFYNEHLNNNLIIEDLLSMRTGLALHDNAWSGIPLNDRDSLLQRIEYLEPSTRLRAKWNYSNFSYFILGAITERLTGETWEANMENSLFKPLKMSSSNLGVKGLMKESNVALGYNVRNNIIEKVAYYDLAAMSPAGDINSNAQDMGNWLLTWLNKGKLEQQQILPEQYVLEAMSSHAVMPEGYLPEEEFEGMYSANYGYGWIISNYKGYYRVEHGGSIDGFRSTVVFFPNEKIGVVVLTNQTNYEPAMMIRNTIVDTLLNIKPTDWINLYLINKEADQPQSGITNIQAETISYHKLQEFVGGYLNPGYGKIKIFQEGNSLYTYFRRRKLKVVPSATEKDVFHAIHLVFPFRRAMPPLRFKKNKLGVISTLSIQFEMEINAIEFNRE